MFNIPGLTDWCPTTLEDMSQLANYYNQIALAQALKRQDYFPNAIYIDAVDHDGTIRTGTRPPSLVEATVDPEGGNTRFAYLDTVLASLLQRACQGPSEPADCARLTQVVEHRRAQYPLNLWEDAAHGRHSSWPHGVLTANAINSFIH